MATMNDGFGLTGIASSDLGLGTNLSEQLQAELQKRKKKAQQAMVNPLQGSAAMQLLGTAANG